MLDTIGQYKKICIEYTAHDLSELWPGTEYNPQPSDRDSQSLLASAGFYKSNHETRSRKNPTVWSVCATDG